MDLDGRKVRALDENSQRNIINSVELDYEHLVRFNENGEVDWRFIKSNLGGDYDVNSNISTLMRMAQNKNTITVSESDGFEYKNKYGDIITKEFFNSQNPEHFEFDINKVSFTTGYTILPNGKDADLFNGYSLDGNINIFISNAGNHNKGKTTAHELFLHARFFLLDLQSNHKTHHREFWQNKYESQSTK